MLRGTGTRIRCSTLLPPAMTDVPRITTERLLLREFRDEDFPAYARMMANPG